ncbi:cell envelope integrity protein CreD [Enterobacter sp.]|uniref:cell envelope integrity protein CreD n=1 Tax=Enterobacter sp. TaxID=42895 RepID=UPI00296F1EC4|nr:cell envelope integrity protein CreD [Enterobacter sp.]
MFKSPLFWKIFTLAGCMVVLLIPLTMLSNLIEERADYRADVADTLRQSSAGAQKLTGPLIAVPITEITTVIQTDGDNPAKEIKREKNYIHYWLPESLMVDGKQQVETRDIGIYEGQIWHGDISIKAEFDPKRLGIKVDENTLIGEPFAVLMVSDSRGIGQVRATKINGETLSVEPGTGLTSDLEGIHIPLGSADRLSQVQTLEMDFRLNGTSEFSVVPLGRNSAMTLNSDWPHPGFMGDFLPEKREVSASGFQASWQSSWFANNLDSKIADRELSQWQYLPAFSASIATTADQYQLTDRALNYSILLISLTFMAFFVFEMLTARQLHPLQYLLVGLSLVMFYLVLLALSEHIGFTPAWIIASILGAMINGVYLQGIMQSRYVSMAFAGALLLLDGVMWGLLNSEDNALLLGTGVLFAALSTVMILTRRFDWYSLSHSNKKAQPQPADDELRIWK